MCGDLVDVVEMKDVFELVMFEVKIKLFNNVFICIVVCIKSEKKEVSIKVVVKEEIVVFFQVLVLMNLVDLVEDS